MLEIRGHARGGQGMVTAFEILANIFSHLGDFQVQAFPAFGVERTGAPVQAFLRVARNAIHNRSNIYHPHLIVVFDESLIDMAPVFGGLKAGGAVLINTEKPRAAFDLPGCSVYTIPATRISLDHGLGSKSLPIVNSAMIGAMGYLFEADLEVLLETVRANVPAKPEANANAAALAYHQVVGDDFPNAFLQRRLHQAPEAETDGETPFRFVETPEPAGIDAPFWAMPLSNNKTGNWRVVTPRYVDRRPPCNHNCPAGTDVRRFVQLAASKDYAAALEAIYEHNPFPGVCGRVCPHFCEQNCNRNALDEGLNIGAIERFLGDHAPALPVRPAPVTQEEKIAVVGAGPAGLTAALRLCEKGYAVTVFDALPQAGGMMRSGIPKFRLPDAVLDKEIGRIEQKGVRIELNRKVNVSALAQQFQAVVAAVGSHVGASLHLENENTLTLDGIGFLREFKLQRNNAGIRKGERVAIIGGGNTAIDVSRTVLRLGAEPVIYYRRTLAEMPAIAQEVEEALAEGVQIRFLTAPAGLSKNAGGQIDLALISMVLGEPDASGRRKPVPVPGSEQVESVHHVIKAIGQHYDAHVFGGQALTPRQGKTDLAGPAPVFCAGDMAWGGTVTEAVGSGNKVAEEVHAFFRGLDYHPEETLPDIVLPQDINYTYYLPTPKHRDRLRRPDSLYQDFDELSAGLREPDIAVESARCLHCGDCFSCGNCFNFCPDAAIHIDEDGRLRIDYDYCKGCGICAEECPCSAIEFTITETVL
ncbi:MAG: 2-oxoacid:acceptor oxidoreductase family protein [Saprospirales bacterium]|jgi:2-oxoacid:acceptor oxidoreductase gamma subunit (pyruvate/2-ketoisovalerate family)/2-oxoacid:acceptor oxidoreductase delta subunit (pyruvate/2-ketoisovalerate family)|nr:2-oxoacid:acceptor oxidoreductase family protein [Saprospirales bacterium]MBK8921271.1 2-oxoacid:acceptor oxidoreductase family protein [Saprospirales bacterium]